MFTEAFGIANRRIERVLTVGERPFRSSIEDLSDGHGSPDKAWWQAFLRGGRVSAEGGRAKPIRIVDAFCGCEGLSLGFSEAAMAMGVRTEHIAAIDLDDAGLQVYRANFRPRHLIHSDVASLVDFHILGRGGLGTLAYEPQVIHSELSREVGNVDVLLAGPPCQGHSNLNNRTRRDDPRNLLYLTAVALAVSLDVKALVVENVPEVKSDRTGVVDSAKGILAAAGYSFVDDAVLATDALGGSQRRRRHFLVAVRDVAETPIPSLREVAAKLKRPASTVGWAIGDLMSLPDHGVMHSTPALSEENLRRIKFLFEEDLYDLPDHERPDCHKAGTTYRSVYGRMKWDEPAQTITTGFLTPGRGRFIHPKLPRVLTPREAARLQSFPDSYIWIAETGVEPGRNQITKWIGDAVPPILGYAAAMPILSGLVAQSS